MEDIEPADEWILLRDSEEFPYYYNPLTMKMSWKLPEGTSQCQERVTFHWWKFHPQPQGQCPQFASKRCLISSKLLCNVCWEKSGTLEDIGQKKSIKIKGKAVQVLEQQNVSEIAT